MATSLVVANPLIFAGGSVEVYFVIDTYVTSQKDSTILSKVLLLLRKLDTTAVFTC